MYAVPLGPTPSPILVAAIKRPGGVTLVQGMPTAGKSRMSPASVSQKSPVTSQNVVGIVGSWMIWKAAPLGLGSPWNVLSWAMYDVTLAQVVPSSFDSNKPASVAAKTRIVAPLVVLSMARLPMWLP